MEHDKILDQLDERAQQLRRSEFIGPDYVPDADALFEEDRLHAEIVYLDDVTNPEVVVEAGQAESFESVEDAIDDLADVVDAGLDSLTSTILQQKEDAAVEAASAIKHYPIAVFGQPDFGDRVIDVDVDNNDILDGQKTQTTELVAIRDLMEDVFVEQREQRRFENTEDAEFSEIQDDMYKREQVLLLENMNETLKDIERNSGGQGGGLFDSLLDMVGLGGKDKDKPNGKDNGINRRGKKSGFLGGKVGSIITGAMSAGAAMYVFDDFLWGDETDPTDKGFIGALGSTLFGGGDSDAETQREIETAKETYKTQLETNTTTTEVLKESESDDGDSSPFMAGATALGGALAVGAGYKKFVGESNPMMGTKGGVNAALHLPALPSPTTNPVQSAMAKGGALASTTAQSSKSLLSKVPYLQLLMGGIDAYSTVTNDELTTNEKVADLSGIGGGYAGAAAGAALGSLIPIPLVGTALGGIAGYMMGESAVTGTMDWLLGNDRDAEKIPEELTAEQATMQDVQSKPDWWDAEPVETSDGKILAGDRTFPSKKVYEKLKDNRVQFNKDQADKTIPKTETTVMRVNGEVVTDMDEAQVETSKLSAEATTTNSTALDKLTDAIEDAGLGLTGLGTIAGSAKTAWDWAKGVFGIGESESETTAEKAVVAPVNIEAQLATQYGDAAVDTVEAATAPTNVIKDYKTSAALYDTAQSTHATSERVSHTNATLKEAVSAVKTYSETQRGYDNWIDDFGKTDVTYEQFLGYFKGGTAPQFMGGSNISKEVVSSEVESNNDTELKQDASTVHNTKEVMDTVTTNTTMDGVVPVESQPSEVNWTPTESPWHNWSKSHSDYGKFSDQGDANVNPTVNPTIQHIDQNPNSNIEIAPANTDVKHTNFVEARHTILDTATDVKNSANVNQSESKPTNVRKTTRENIKTRPTNRGAGRTARPSISAVPIMVDDSGLTALNLGYL